MSRVGQQLSLIVESIECSFTHSPIGMVFGQIQQFVSMLIGQLGLVSGESQREIQLVPTWHFFVREVAMLVRGCARLASENKITQRERGLHHRNEEALQKPTRCLASFLRLSPTLLQF